MRPLIVVGIYCLYLRLNFHLSYFFFVFCFFVDVLEPGGPLDLDLGGEIILQLKTNSMAAAEIQN